MKNKIHTDVVTDYAINNKVSLTTAYTAILDEKFAQLDEMISKLRCDVELALEEARFQAYSL
jgi:hypothetical protein